MRIAHQRPVPFRPQRPGYRGEQTDWPWTAIGDHPGGARSYWNRDAALTANLDKLTAPSARGVPSAAA